MLAAATFLAMPYTFRSGGHIRVSLLTARLPATVHWVLELIVRCVGAGLVGFALCYIVALILESANFGDVSPGIVPVPLWIPQSAMGVGMALLRVAMVDALVATARRRAPVIAGPAHMTIQQASIRDSRPSASQSRRTLLVGA